MKWHSKTIEEALKYFGTDREAGLSANKVKEMEQKCGSNSMEERKSKSKIVLLLEQFNNPLIYILIAAAIVTAIVADPTDSIVIAVVVILNTLIGFFQEIRAEDALKALQEMAAPHARVIRDGKQQEILTSEVVCGDIILLESGARVPADGRLISSQNLLVDESMLTGESFSIEKNSEKIIEEDASLGDRINYVYSGTIIQKGRGQAVVTAVGKNAEFGKISKQVAEAEEQLSPLQINLAKLGKWIGISIMIAVVFIFIIGFMQGNGWAIMLLTSIGLAVSAIPEGLPVAVTITLSIGIYQMAKHKAVVKKLAAVETLGSTNIICSDKTGTLTKNQMTVTRMYSGGRDLTVTGTGYGRKGEVFYGDEKLVFDSFPSLEYASKISALCTESGISENGDDWKITGDPTEVALMIAARKLGCEDEITKVSVDIPFESENQFMAVSAQNGENRYILMKGAPEQTLARCSREALADGTYRDVDVDELMKKSYEFSEGGLRVIALAYGETTRDGKIGVEDLKDLTFVGFAGIQDPIREEAVEAIKDCHSAGIKVVMITGDHAQTAKAIARAAGLEIKGKEPLAITGKELDKIDDDELYEKVRELDVYARVAPEHKYRIVKQMQRRNNIVAMTGDGVNDAPALKQADIGVAMGSGSDVAKESASMILMDDNFATIVKAVRRGRVVLHNLQHILLYILATSAGGLLTVASSVIAGFPLPILPAQLLWINLVTDGTSTFPLGFEKEHGNVMVFPPRKKTDPLITTGMIVRFALAGAFMAIGTLTVFYFSAPDIYALTGSVLGAESSEALRKSQTLAFSILGFYQIWNVQNSRSADRSLFFKLPFDGKNKLDPALPNKNPTLLFVMLLAIALQFAAVSLPFMNDLLHTVPLTFSEWLMVFGLTFSIVVAVEIGKFVRALLKKKTETYQKITGEEIEIN